jgi:hypothetical protein
MAIFRFDLWKHSDLYGLDNYWSNRWYVDTPRSMQDTYIDMGILIPIEATFHHTHVRYSHVTVVNPLDPEDATMWAANNYDPFHPEYRGAVGYTSEPLPFKWIKRVRKYPTMGRSGFWWFRGGLEASEVDPATRGAHASNNAMQPWRNRLSDWLLQLQAHGMSLHIGIGANQAGAPTLFIPVETLVYDGISEMNASTRSQVKTTGTGPTIYGTIIPQTVVFRDWVFQVGTWWNAHNDFTPTDAKDNSVTMIGQLKAIMSQIKDWADKVSQHQTDALNPTYLRWQPSAAELTDFAGNVVSGIENDLSTIDQITPWTPDGVHFFIKWADVDSILNILIKDMAVYSQMSLVDYRNRSNSRLG